MKKQRKVNVAFHKHELGNPFGQPKLTLRFVIMDTDEMGVEVQRHYRLSRFDKKGRAYAPKSSYVARDFERLFPDYRHRPGRPLPLSRLQNLQVKVELRTVTIDSRGDEMAPQSHYEVIDRFDWKELHTK